MATNLINFIIKFKNKNKKVMISSTNKALVGAAALILAMNSEVAAQPRPRQRLYIEFGMCRDSTCDPGVECCEFKAEKTSEEGKFCMTDNQKNGDWQGLYTDDENKSWEWTCYNSRPKTDDDKKVVIEEKEVIPPGVFDNMTPENQWIIDSFAWIYWSDMGWILGYVIQFTLGLFIYCWISLETPSQFFEALNTGNFGSFAMGPYRRMISGWTIYWINVFLTLIPGVNFAAPFIMYEWAKADYFDYYTKIVPMAKEEAE